MIYATEQIKCMLNEFLLTNLVQTCFSSVAIRSLLMTIIGAMFQKNMPVAKSCTSHEM